MKILVIIPAFNEEKSILAVAKAIKDYDYIIINDASTDGTEKICRENKLNYITLSNNLGIGGAMQTGYLYALTNGYDVALQFDGDGQHIAGEIPKLIDGLEDCDVVIGSRYIERTTNNEQLTTKDDLRCKSNILGECGASKQGTPETASPTDWGEFHSTPIRRVGIGFFSWLIKRLTGEKVTDPTSGFRAVNKKVIKVFADKYPADYPEPETIVSLVRNGFKVGEVSVKMKERAEGKSSITWAQSIYYMCKVTIACLFAKWERIKK